jgi:hypothetical protein
MRYSSLIIERLPSGKVRLRAVGAAAYLAILAVMVVALTFLLR